MSNTREHSKLVPERLPVILFTCLASGCWSCKVLTAKLHCLKGVYLLLWATEERNCTGFLEKGELLTVSCCHTDGKQVTSRAVENASWLFCIRRVTHLLWHLNVMPIIAWWMERPMDVKAETSTSRTALWGLRCLVRHCACKPITQPGTDGTSPHGFVLDAAFPQHPNIIPRDVFTRFHI